MTTLEISKMSVLERLQTMEALWDSLTHDNSEIMSPSWHGETLFERTKSIENGSAQFKSLDELKLKNK